MYRECLGRICILMLGCKGLNNNLSVSNDWQIKRTISQQNTSHFLNKKKRERKSGMITKKKIHFKNPYCLLTFSLYLIAITSPLVRQANDLSAFSKLCYLLGKVFYILQTVCKSQATRGKIHKLLECSHTSQMDYDAGKQIENCFNTINFKCFIF